MPIAVATLRCELRKRLYAAAYFVAVCCVALSGVGPLGGLNPDRCLAADTPPAGALNHADARRDEKTGVDWFDIRKLAVEGQGFPDTKAPFDRLPARAEKTVRSAVWNLSRHSAGISVRFVTDATVLRCRWSLISANLAMPHMPATGVSGVDLYARDDAGRWRWVACGRPTKQTNEVTLVSGIPPGTREFQLYLPLYNGVSSVEIGVPAAAAIAPGPPRPEGFVKPIVFYGTSITHGACASRPGMPHPAILGRWFDRPVINLGFSGNGRMEPEVVRLIAEIDAAVFVLDCLPNMTAADVTARTKPCVDILRAAHPHTPIVLVEDRSYADSWLVPGKRERNRSSRAALKKVFAELQQAGVRNLYYVDGDALLGDDNEATVDSSHPTDLGFVRQATVFAKTLRPLLPEPATARQ